MVQPINIGGGSGYERPFDFGSGVPLPAERARTQNDQREDYSMTNIPGLKVLNKALLQGVGAGATNLPKWAKIEPPSSEEVAANVLGFISRNLQTAAANGANQD